MKCALCLQTADLCDSHIIPEFFYKLMYDSKHRFFRSSSNPEKRNVTLQKGVRETLLCHVCETRFSRHEGYVKRLLFDGGIGQWKDDGRYLHVRGFDYKQVKLLFLSILWRMSVSGLDFFRGVKLGLHQERLRAMLLKDDPGTPQDYGVVAVAPYFEGGRLGNWFPPPHSERVGAGRLCHVVMGGLLFIFFVPGRDLPTLVTGLFMQADGRWMIEKRKVKDIKFLCRYVLEFGLARHKRTLAPFRVC